MTREQILEERISYFKDDAQEAIKSLYAETLEIISELEEENRKLKEVLKKISFGILPEEFKNKSLDPCEDYQDYAKSILTN